MVANGRQHTLNGYLEPLPDTDTTQLDDLLGIDPQKELAGENTRQFIAGYPANNVLLWGTRGTGKSSLVRALLNRYSGNGLGVMQIDKDDLPSLPDIFIGIRNEAYRFLIFCDALSFDAGEKGYKVLKSALDGSV